MSNVDDIGSINNVPLPQVQFPNALKNKDYIPANIFHSKIGITIAFYWQTHSSSDPLHAAQGKPLRFPAFAGNFFRLHLENDYEQQQFEQ
ncbi:MAG: hypothetical protein Q7W05_15160 [Deltaproteobacteria bacterium]|nr:hypothetical protein [Deltaproteobacteria bacterium]